MTEYMKKYAFWVENAVDASVASELEAMKNDQRAIENAFYKDLEFGTAGLRGIMSAGSDRMNIYTVMKATKGVADYMLSCGMKRAAITFDSRKNSVLFSQTAARVLAGNGIEVFITEECMPTPFLSYAVSSLGCDIGINVTASHNPGEYNGYKVYDGKGCQLTDSAAMAVTGFIEKIDSFRLSYPCFSEAVESGAVKYIDEVLEESYKQAVLKESLNKVSGLKLVYTPLNGAGYRIVPEVLARAGATDVTVVPEQSYPDGNFTTCSYPNPEKKEAMEYAVRLGEEIKADLILGNDPDCDRLGVAVKDGESYKIFTGNEIGVLLCDYILSQRKANASLPENAVVVKTIVTTIMIDKIAQNYGACVEDVLTGFKYIGNVINQLESNGEIERYAFGFEESCGYLKGTYVRDKDGVVACMLTAEMAAYYKKRGLTLAERLRELYIQYGNYYQTTLSYRFEGAEGAERKEKLLKKLRKEPFKLLGESQVAATTDYLTQAAGNLPKADVLKYAGKDGSQLIVRPSGTEPLIKTYITVSGTEEGNAEKFALIKKQTDAYFG